MLPKGCHARAKKLHLDGYFLPYENLDREAWWPVQRSSAQRTACYDLSSSSERP